MRHSVSITGAILIISYMQELSSSRSHSLKTIFLPQIHSISAVNTPNSMRPYSRDHPRSGISVTRSPVDSLFTQNAGARSHLALFESLTLLQEKAYPMAGILPCSAWMTEKAQALGYTQGFATVSCPWIPLVRKTCGHEFHCSAVDTAHDSRFAFRLMRGRGITGGL